MEGFNNVVCTLYTYEAVPMLVFFLHALYTENETNTADFGEGN